jgi:CheY-like chemotaxis protein
MPMMSGSELATALRKQDENIPIIFITGYDRDQDLEKDLPMHNCLVISKPFSFNKLSKLIRSVIASESHQEEVRLQ